MYQNDFSSTNQGQFVGQSYNTPGLYQQDAEKSYIDKTLAIRIVEQVNQLMAKDIYNRKELHDLVYLVNSVELKLWNLSWFDRWVIGETYLVIKRTEELCDTYYKVQEKVDTGQNTLDDSGRLYLRNILELYTTRLKSLINVQLYLGRSTMSLEAYAFDRLSTQRFEYSYPNMQPNYGGAQGLTQLIFGGKKNAQ